MKFKRFTQWSELPKSADTLFYEASKHSLFFSKEWLVNVSNHIINQKQSLLLACVVSNDLSNQKSKNAITEKVEAILPILTNTNREWSAFTHPYSSLFSIYLNKENQAEILDCLCIGLKDYPFDYLSISPINFEDSHVLQLRSAMERNGLSYYQKPCFHNRFHSVKNQTFEQYLMSRPSKLKNTLKRKYQKLKRDHGFTLQLFIDKGISEALDDYHNLYQKSWKANEQHQSLVTDFVKSTRHKAWTRLALLTVAGKPIAAQLWFVVNNKATIFRLVYNEQWKQYSPGSILTAHLMEHVIDKDKVSEIDFLMGNESYKKDWMDGHRERQELIFIKNKKTHATKNSASLMKRFLIKLTNQN